MKGKNMGKVRVIEIKESVFADNDATSKAIREKMSAQRTLFLNVMSGPGSGKTTLLSALINSCLLYTSPQLQESPSQNLLHLQLLPLTLG